MMYRLILAFFFVCSVSVPALRAESQSPRILVMGDSLLATHRMSKRSAVNILARTLGEKVSDNTRSGARVIYKLPISGAVGFNIPQQYRKGNWDWVVVNGGGNDLWLGCGCHRCDRKMDRMISQDGQRGVIPGMLSRIRQNGARVIYVGYLRSPGVNSPIESCRDEGNELEARVARLAQLDRGVYFLSLADLVPHGDRSFHGIDMVHPSSKASTAIGQRIAQLIKHEEGKPD